MDYSSFVIILSRQRSGTNALRSVLKLHPDIFQVPEIFDNRMSSDWDLEVETAHFPAIETSYFTFLEKFSRGRIKKILLAEDHEEIFLDYLEYLRCFTDRRYLTIDVKYMSTHHITKCWHFITEEPFFFVLIKEYNLPVINLTRRNFLRYYLSEVKAQRSQRWHEFDESVVGNQKWYIIRKQSLTQEPERKITIDTAHLLETMRLCRAENMFVETSFADYERYLTFDYDDMFSQIGGPLSDVILERIAQWLDIENDFPQRKPEFRKLSSLSLEETIENYEEVVRVIQGTEFEYCLQDERMYANS